MGSRGLFYDINGDSCILLHKVRLSIECDLSCSPSTLVLFLFPSSNSAISLQRSWYVNPWLTHLHLTVWPLIIAIGIKSCGNRDL
jgi:hypothetical protein